MQQQENGIDFYAVAGTQEEIIDYEATQLQQDSATKLKTPRSNGNDASNNLWGQLRCRKICGERIVDEVLDLFHRVIDGKRDTFTIGRSRKADFMVPDDKKISAIHCILYCDYSQARLRFFVEDCSSNGTFVNDSLTRLTKGERMELRSGYEIFLKNPRNADPALLSNFSFTFINIRERLLAQREAGSANNKTINFVSHIEEKYIIGDQIGSGMSGQVHKCINRETKQQCAVKIIDTRKFALTPGLSIKELKEEAQMMNQLDHPNIVKILDTFQTDHSLLIVMELVQGGDLFDRIVERGRYSEESARLLMAKVLSATSYLHAKDIIHRDLKPENILLVAPDNDVEVKITDFGLAKKASQDGLKTFCGTPQYFAPEVLKRKGSERKSGRYYASADMWSLGVVLYILLSGTFPFDEDNLFEQIEHGQYTLSGPEWGGISTAAKHLVSSLMTLRADRRLTVQQALRHPWITGGSDPNPLPLARSLSSSAAEKKKERTAQAQKEKEALGEGKSPSGRKRKAGEQLAGSEALSRSHSKPHIGTVPLFLVKKITLRKDFLPVTPSAAAEPSQPHNPQLQHQLQHQLQRHQLQQQAEEAAVLAAEGKAAVEEDIDTFSSDEEKGEAKGHQRTAVRPKQPRVSAAVSSNDNSPVGGPSGLPLPLPSQEKRMESPVSLFQLMKLNSLKCIQAAVPDPVVRTADSSNVNEVTNVSDDENEKLAGEIVLERMAVSVSPFPSASMASATGKDAITQYFRPQEGKNANHTTTEIVHMSKAADIPKEVKRQTETINHILPASKRQKSLIEAWKINREENMSPNIVAAKESGEVGIDTVETAKVSYVAAENCQESSSIFHTEEFGDLKKLREPKKSLSAVFKS